MSTYVYTPVFGRVEGCVGCEHEAEPSAMLRLRIAKRNHGNDPSVSWEKNLP